MEQHQGHLYSEFLAPNNGIIDILMGGGGEAFLDREILKAREEIGEQEFHQYATQFFKNSKVDYKELFKLSTTPAPTPPPTSTTLTSTQQDEEQIVQPSPSCPKKQEEPVQQILQIDPQKYTDNSESFENQFQEIERQDLGNNKVIIKYRNGDMYEGEVQNDIKNGWGTYHYQSGQKYSGCFIDDQINGYGRYYFLSGAEYEGDWSSGMKHGIGILKFSNKDVYEGNFVRDDFHGMGTYTYHNGDVFTGIFKQGKKNGNGTLSCTDGRLQIGQWVADKFEV